MMLVLLSPRRARSNGREVHAGGRQRPMPSVVPVGSAAVVDAARIAGMAAARSTMHEPPTGLMNPPTGTVLSASVRRLPSSRPARRSCRRDLDDDRLDQHLRAADVELVDDAHDLRA